MDDTRIDPEAVDIIDQARHPDISIPPWNGCCHSAPLCLNERIHRDIEFYSFF